MAFWDASAIVPLCFSQPATGILRRFLRRYGRPVIWWGTPIEVRSALARLMREGVIDAQGHRETLARLMVLRESWAEVLPTEKVRSVAEAMPDEYSLRAPDAWQLAAAVVWCRERPRGRPFVCYDRRLAQAAGRAGFLVLPH